MLSLKVFVGLILAISFANAHERSVICYIGTWAAYRPGNGHYDIDHIDPHLCTHLIYSFAGIDHNGYMHSLDPWLDLPEGRNFFGRLNDLKHRNHNLRTLLAVGGWNEGSAKYSIMAANLGLRQNFINSALRMVLDHGFNGLDLDWEYPNRRDTVHGWADVNNFTQLLRELREVFNRHGLLLTAAVSAVRAEASQSYDIPAISHYLDIVNLMTYDLAGAWDSETGHNGALYRGENYHGHDEELFTVEQAVRFWISAGCPPHKIAVGVPFYGRTFRLRDAHNNGVRAPAAGAGLAGPYTREAGFMGYNEICYKLRTEPWTRRYDGYARVPYTHRDHDWVTYDDAGSIADKVHFARSLGINKIMVWSIETDDFRGICGEGTYPLLRSINNNL